MNPSGKPRRSSHGLGSRVKQLRLEAGESQRTLASKVGVSFTHISKIESNAEQPSVKLLLKIAATLNADPDELLRLAERVPPDLAEFMHKKDHLATHFLRSWKAGKIKDKDVETLLEG